MYTAAGLLSGAPRPMPVRNALRAAAPRPVLILAGGAVADELVAARWFRPPRRPPSMCGWPRRPGTRPLWPPSPMHGNHGSPVSWTRR